MKNSALSFGGSISGNYEELLGPFLFEPYAIDLSQRIDFTGVENMLELACGSGRLTRHIAGLIKDPVHFTATDLNDEMLGIARQKVTSPQVHWATVDMLNIPFADNHFDLVVCQFGIMLVPEQNKALAEIYRVIKPGGKLVFSTWAGIEENKLWLIGDDVLNSYLDLHPLRSKPGPFSMANDSEVLRNLKEAGFQNYTASAVATLALTDSALHAANGFIQGLPVFSIVQQKAPEQLHQIVLSLAKKLTEQFGDDPLEVPQQAWLFEAQK